MPSLLNPTPYPSGLRCCYWDAAYIASQPFCITSKLTEKEAQVMADFEEMKLWERNEQLKSDLSLSDFDLEQAIEEIKTETKQVSIERIAVLELAKMQKESLDSITSKLSPDFRRYHAKTINKSDYLTR